MNLDIFNRKKVRELEEELERTRIECNKYRNMAVHLEYKLDEVSKSHEATPEDCKIGKWCAACEFGRTMRYMSHYDFNTDIRVDDKIYICGKGEICKHFVKNEVT